MPAPLDVDLRERVVTAYTSGEGTYDEIARRFVVSPASVSRYLRRHREQGSLAPKLAIGGQPHRLDEPWSPSSPTRSAASWPIGSWSVRA